MIGGAAHFLDGGPPFFVDAPAGLVDLTGPGRRLLGKGQGRLVAGRLPGLRELAPELLRAMVGRGRLLGAVATPAEEPDECEAEPDPEREGELLSHFRHSSTTEGGEASDGPSLYSRDFLPRRALNVPERRTGGGAASDRRKEEFGNVNPYEVLLMLDAELADERQAEIIARAEEIVMKGGGAWHRSEPWGRRKLAYEIDHKGEAFYHLLTFDSDPATLDELTRVLRITDGAMRHMAVKRPRGSAKPAKANVGPAE